MTNEQTFTIQASARLARSWGGHDVRSQPEDGDEGGDAGELVPGRDLRFTEIPLNEQQFDAIVGDKAYRSFFSTAPSTYGQRLHASFGRIPLLGKFKNCTVSVVFGLEKKTVTIEAATIKNRSVVFGDSGPQLQCTVVGARPRTLDVLDLEEQGGKPVDVELVFGALSLPPAEQQQLPLQQPAVASTPTETPASDAPAPVIDQIAEHLAANGTSAQPEAA